MYLSFTRDVIGPITRTVADSAVLLGVISGQDPRDPESSSKPVPNYLASLKDGVKGKTFGVPRKLFYENLHPDTQKVMEEALKAVKDLGATLKELEVRNMEIATPSGFNIVLAECIYHLEDYLKAFDPEATIEKYAEQFGPDVKPPIVGSKAKPVPGFVYAKSVREDRNKMIAGFRAAMSGVEALLMPTTPLTEEIITSLSKTPKLIVMDRKSTLAYKGKTVDLSQIGRELGVQYILTGSVREAGERVRISTQLIHAGRGEHLWAERYDMIGK